MDLPIPAIRSVQEVLLVSLLEQTELESFNIQLSDGNNVKSLRRLANAITHAQVNPLKICISWEPITKGAKQLKRESQYSKALKTQLFSTNYMKIHPLGSNRKS